MFVDGCSTVHDYKNRIKEGSWCRYEITECFIMKYDKFIWLCNHILERNSGTARHGENEPLKASLFFSTSKRASRVLLLAGDKVAVLYAK